MGPIDKNGKIGTLIIAGFMLLSTMAHAQQMSIASYFKNNPDGSQTLLDHVPKEVAAGLAVKVSHADSNQVLDLRIVLPSQNQTGLNNFIADIYNPKSANYHKFLTPAQFALMFGPSSVDTSIVIQYLKSQGLTVTKQSKNGLILSVTGPVSKVEPTFKLNINNYKALDGNIYFAPDTNPTIPVQVAGKIYAIVGMDNMAKFRPHLHRGVPLSVKKNNSPVIGTNLHATAALSPPSSQAAPPAPAPSAFQGYGGSMGPADIADAYNLNSVTSKGAGQTVGVWELDGYLTSDITAFRTYYGIPSVTLTNVYTDSYNGAAGTNADEVVLDIDLVLAVAPGLNSIRVYEAPDTGIGSLDNWETIVNDPSHPNIISISWGGYEGGYYYSGFSTYFNELSTMGVTVFASAGDAGAYDNCDVGTLPPDCTVNGSAATGIVSVDYPASEPTITGVGISVLSVSNPGNSNESYSSEAASLYGGGGVSSIFSIPSFQTAAAAHADNPTAMVSTAMRNVPDVVFTADSATAYGIYYTDPTDGAGWYGYWGSSAATPIWAAFMSRVNQGRVAEDISVVGFLNPIIYQIAQSSHYTNDFHDITTGNNDYYSAETGYDDAAGLGSFNGANLYGELLGAPAPTGLSPTAGNQQVLLSWTASAGAASYNVKRSTTNGGSYTTISTSGAVTGTAYTDSSGLTNGTPYYYVVSAVDIGGVEGPNSTQVTATPTVVLAAPVITAQPGNQTVTAPATAAFTVTATGAPSPTYQWMESISGGSYVNVSGGSGATSASYTTPATALSNSGTQYECVVSNSQGTVTSNPATLTVNTVPTISAQPTAQTVTAPATATFTVVAAGSPSPTYQWMESVSGGSYVNVSGGSGATSASYTTGATTASNNGTQYKCVVTNSAGSVTSNAVALTVDAVPAISTQPNNQIVTAPATATFTVAAVGAPVPTYQWMESISGGSYVNVSGGSGATSASYTTPATALSNSGTQYECVVSNSQGTVTSNPATITVNTVPTISAQPTAQTVTAPATATFTVVAAGSPSPTYQWMESVSGGSYVNVSGGSGATSVSYTTGATTALNNGTQYECVVSNSAGTAISNPVTLTVDAVPVVTTQPSNQTVIAPATATFTVVAVGLPSPTYQWMESVSGGSYVNVSGGSGATSASYTTPATALSDSGTQYECVVSNSQGTVTSNPATITVNTVPAISAQPTAQAVTAPATATFTVVAAGSPAPAYQWKESVNNAPFVNVSGGSGAASASYTTGATAFSNNGTQYECVVSNAAGTVTSNAVALSVVSVPNPPTTVSATAGNALATVTFSGASANGSPISLYTVTSNPGSISVTGASSPITVTGLNNYTQYIFTVTATNNIGMSAASAPSNAVTPTPAPVPGVCGTASTTYAYGVTSFGSNGLCAVGSPNPTTVVFPAAGQTIGWTCQGINGGGNSSCTAKQNPRVIFKF